MIIIDEFLCRLEILEECKAVVGESETGLLIALSLCWLSVDLRGHVTDGKTQFIPSVSFNWLLRCFIT